MTRPRRLLTVLGLIVLASSSGNAALAAARRKVPVQASLPSFASIEKIVRDHFKEKKYKPQTLISQGDVAPLFSRFEKAGWKVEDQKEILSQVLDDKDFMVQQLRLPDAENFVAQVSQYPEGYDRTDRLRRLPRGETFLYDLIRNPGGYNMIEYMALAPGGINMGDMLSEIPEGRNFNKATGRLYTYEQFVARLHESYDRAEASQKGSKKPRGG